MMSALSTRALETPKETELAVDHEESNTGQLLLDTLADEASRAILAAIGDEALSAKEVSERCAVPLSSTYRKLDRLTEVGLSEERIRVRRSGKHTSEYRRLVDDIHVTVSDEGEFMLTVER